MQSVTLDLFAMPALKHEGQTYDTMVVCVDRHSGWIVAEPCLGKGLTGQKVAKLMMRHQWRLFGVPSVITSDQGSQFVSGWWKTLCAVQGIRHAYSQAYHHRANGRAERAGQQIMEKARKIQIDEGMTWVESLPQILDRIHDTVGESGMSPYEVLFGRHRPLGGLPYVPQRECEDALSFFRRQRDVDEKVAKHLNDLHVRQSSYHNRGLLGLMPFQRWDKVWYLRPPDAGNKLDSKWLGPCLVMEREGENSYIIQVKEGQNIKAHRMHLKGYVEDEENQHQVDLFHHQRTVPLPDSQPDMWFTEAVLNHRVNQRGQLELLTKWQGYDEANWEPVGSFFHSYSADLVDYCQRKGVNLNLSQCLSPRAH